MTSNLVSVTVTSDCIELLFIIDSVMIIKGLVSIHVIILVLFHHFLSYMIGITPINCS